MKSKIKTIIGLLLMIIGLIFCGLMLHTIRGGPNFDESLMDIFIVGFIGFSGMGFAIGMSTILDD